MPSQSIPGVLRGICGRRDSVAGALMSESTDPAAAAASRSSVPAGTGSVGVPRAKRRVPFWDNSRFACIVLVVLGHATQRLTYDSDIALGLYLLIYAFHMPALAVISGYFSRSGAPTRTQMARVITDILVPYVIFEALWTLTKWLVEGQANPNPTQPSWTLWFLLALGHLPARPALPRAAAVASPVDRRHLGRGGLPAQHRLDAVALAHARPPAVLHARLVAARARHRGPPRACSTGDRGGPSPPRWGPSPSRAGPHGSSSTTGEP